MSERRDDGRYDREHLESRGRERRGYESPGRESYRTSGDLSPRDHDLSDYDYGEYRRDAARHDRLGSSHDRLDHRGEPRDVRGSESYGLRGGREEYRESGRELHRGGLSGRGSERSLERGSERYESRDRDSREAEDFEQYRGRDYGFSWTDGSNDATWRNFDRWGNEYSNHSRGEGFGWNRGSTRDPHFWSSPDRER